MPIQWYVQKVVVSGLLIVVLGGVQPAAAKKTVTQASAQAVVQAPTDDPAAPQKPSPKKVRKKKVVVPETAQTIDRIVVVVFADDGSAIIRQSDLDRPGLTGAKKTLDALIFEQLVYLDAKHYKAVPDDDAVDKYMARVMREHNLQIDDLKQMFANAGYTFEEGKEELRRIQAVSSMVSNRVHSSIMVSRHEVERYYKENPEIVEGALLIEQAALPYEADKKAQRKKIINNEIKIVWSEPIRVAPSELSEKLQFLDQLDVGKITVHKARDGFELFRVIEKTPSHTLSLDERYQDIVDILARPKYEEMLDKYKADLTKAASIVYC
jgi:hypothetical protein